MKKFLLLWLQLFFSVTLLAQTAPPFSPVLAGFAVLGNTGVSNTGPSVLTGNVGVSPGTTLTGFPPGLTLGTQERNSLLAQQAHSNLLLTYNHLAAQPPTADLTGQNLGGKTLTPGVYKLGSAAQLNGVLTLNANTNPDALFIFQVSGDFSVATGATLLLLNGARAGNVFWQVGGTATLQTGTLLRGNVLASGDIHLHRGALLEGRALSVQKAVNLHTNAVLLPVTSGLAPTADLSVTKTIAPGTYLPGTTVTYTITIKNLGPADATLVQVFDLLPANLTFVSATATAGVFNHETGVFALGNLNNGGTATLTVTALVNGSGPVENTATVVGGQVDPNPSNNTGGAVVNSPVADLSVTKTINQAPAYRIGDEVTYTITVKNQGPGSAANVVVSEKLAAQLTFVSASATAGTYNPETGQYQVGTLQAGATATLTLRARINGAGSIVNSVTVSGSPTDPLPANNTVTVPICVAPATPAAISGSTRLCAGSTETYTAPALAGVVYQWTTSAGLVIESGQGTAQVRVRAENNAAAAGQIQVAARNECGTSQSFTLAVAVAAPAPTPGEISGNPTPCAGSTQRYAVAGTTGLTYTWQVPTGYTILAGQGTAAVDVRVGGQPGPITVQASNGCAPASAARSRSLTPNQPPAPAGPISDVTTPCTGLSYSVVPVNGVSTYTWTVPAGWQITSGQGTPVITVTAPNPEAQGQITVETSNGTCAAPPVTRTVSAASDLALNLPTAITPNGDGLNEAFVVRNLPRYPDNELVIVNRWGSEVFRQKNYQNNWSATGLADGTYFYTLRARLCENEMRTFRGYITVAR